MEALAPFYRDLVDLKDTASRKRGWIVFGLPVVVQALWVVFSANGPLTGPNPCRGDRFLKGVQ